jgi:CHAT domain-containing protein/predicted negative regulator of RcsB-dependent stress response
MKARSLRKAPRSVLIFLVVLLCHVPCARAQESSGDKEADARKAQALLTLSERQNYENHALALETARQALALWQASGDSEGVARAYAHIGRCYFAQSELSEAVQNYERALQLWRDLNNPHEQAEVLIMLGYIENRKGEWTNSISFFTQAQNLVESKDETYLLGQIAAGLAYIFSESGLPENGLAQYQRALDYYRQTPDTRDDAVVLLEMGSTYYQVGNTPEALSSIQQALVSFEPDSLGAAHCLKFLGEIYVSMGETDAALRHLEPALLIYTRAVNPKEAAQVRALIGRAFQQLGQIERARQNYLKALDSFHKLSDRINQAAVLYALGRLELERNNLDAAEEYLRQSIEATENMRRVSTSRDLTAAFSATVHERYEAYVECLMRKHQQDAGAGLDVRAFETSELAHARSLAELLRATGTNLVSVLDPQLTEKEKSLRQTLRVKEDFKVALLGTAYKKEELDALEAELARLNADYKQVNEEIRARYPSYEQITQPVAWDMKRIQTEVVADDETVLLEYSLGANRSYVWAVTRDRVTSVELPSQAVVNATAQRVYELLATPPGAGSENDLTQAAQELSRMILAPVAASLNKHRIIVVADGALNYIPFQFLPSPAPDGELMTGAFEIVNAPSASTLGQLRRETLRRQSPSKLLAAFGDPVFASDYALRKGESSGAEVASAQPPVSDHLQFALRDVDIKGDSFDPSAMRGLIYAKLELANLREVARGDETFVASGFDATRERLQSTDLTKYAILHFATHGLLDPKRPEHSGLILSTVNSDGKAQDGFLTLQDIYNLHAPVDLVVLSACRTGLGKEIKGEGLIGLTRGFMYAGASSVVASLWKVDDEATSELMKRFYANMLQGGQTPAAALREAQNSIRQEPRWRSPYYWAAFTLQGEYRQVIKSAPASATRVYTKILWGAALLALLAGAGFWFQRRRRVRAA